MPRNDDRNNNDRNGNNDRRRNNFQQWQPRRGDACDDIIAFEEKHEKMMKFFGKMSGRTREETEDGEPITNGTAKRLLRAMTGNASGTNLSSAERDGLDNIGPKILRLPEQNGGAGNPDPSQCILVSPQQLAQLQQNQGGSSSGQPQGGGGNPAPDQMMTWQQNQLQQQQMMADRMVDITDGLVLMRGDTHQVMGRMADVMDDVSERSTDIQQELIAMRSDPNHHQQQQQQQHHHQQQQQRPVSSPRVHPSLLGNSPGPLSAARGRWGGGGATAVVTPPGARAGGAHATCGSAGPAMGGSPPGSDGVAASAARGLGFLSSPRVFPGGGSAGSDAASSGGAPAVASRWRLRRMMGDDDIARAGGHAGTGGASGGLFGGGYSGIYGAPGAGGLPREYSVEQMTLIAGWFSLPNFRPPTAAMEREQYETLIMSKQNIAQWRRRAETACGMSADETRAQYLTIKAAFDAVLTKCPYRGHFQ